MPNSEDPRVARLNDRPVSTGGQTVIYWMQNSQRPDDNPALNEAIRIANELSVGVAVYVALDVSVPHATARTFSFLIDGLRETLAALRERRIGSVVRIEQPVDGIVRLVRELRACAVVTDLSPLQRGRRLRALAAERLDVALLEVDGDHVVPLRLIGREHWAARTLRPVIQRLWPAFLVDDDDQPRPRVAGPDIESLDLDAARTDALLERLGVDRVVPPAIDITPGPAAANRRLRQFVESGIAGYGNRRRDVERSGSGLSPYLRFGQVSPVRAALAASGSGAPHEDVTGFLEELIVRRELGSNFVFYNPAYRTLDGLPAWARETLTKHAQDARSPIYQRDGFAAAATHDVIWNAAQRELLARGRIHNYVRMYWGKKIIEWSATPAEALSTALWLNDRFALDGRSANGFANVLWCFGKHDRPWAERPIFGTVRWMSEQGTRSKLDVTTYLRRWGSDRDAEV